MSGRAQLRQRLEERLEHAAPAQPREPLPDAVPIAELGRERTPGDVVDREVVHRGEKALVVTSLIAATRQATPEHLEHHCPVLLIHPRQHGRSPQADPL